jgi:hypothetical protein
MTETIRNWNPDEGDLCQGDVLLFRLPEGLTPARTDNIPAREGRLILAEGERAGHHHAIWVSPPMFRDDGLARAVAPRPHIEQPETEAEREPTTKPSSTALYQDNNLLRRLVDDGLLTEGSLCVGFLVVEDAPVLLRHHEHDAIRIPAGFYYIGRQREFHAGEARRVID